MRWRTHERTKHREADDTRADRRCWLDILQQLAEPVLEAAATRQLRQRLPIETSPVGSKHERSTFAHLEATARLLCGLAPWLELTEQAGDASERRMRQQFRQLALEAITSGADPASPDYFNIEGKQPLVDAAFLALALKRAPHSLWEELDATTKRRLLDLFRQTRQIQPYFNNWLLFPAAIEAFLRMAGENDWDPLRIDFALRQHNAWYLGDGLYSDGPHHRWDHYNGFVIHPFLLDITDLVSDGSNTWTKLRHQVIARAIRYAEVQERLISPEGTYPPLGRSLAYRFGLFHALGSVILRRALPTTIGPGQARAAMTAVLTRQMSDPTTFDDSGWLTIGLVGRQPCLGERYISTGSLYLCTTGLIPLGLPPEDEFWTAPGEPWTACRAWSGESLPRDEALEARKA